MSIPTIQGLAGVVQEPELRHTQAGKPILNLRLAFSDRKLENGQWITSKSFFVDAAAWEDTAERLANTIGKGDQVYVEGRLETQSWEKDGQQRSKPAMTIRTMRKLEKAQQQGGQQPQQQQQSGGWGQPANDPWGAPQGGAQNVASQLGGQPVDGEPPF